MGNIQIMDEWLSNKIAAGEVVERPASVVKELVENAIDAGSSSIDVFLLEAGLTSIQVIDNGSGMDEEDALMSFSRHATSKIHQEHDLFRIRTLGFRGEALASIASVSKMTLITSNGESGTHLELEGGHILTHKPGPLRKGTDLTVSQLFFNTPARLKYMKTIQTELGHTIDLMNRLVLGNPQIAFRLLHNGQQLLQTNGRGDVQQVLAAIYGIHNAKKMVSFQGESHDYRISGFVSLPEVTRASKNYMSLFVNGRWVKHYLVQKAIVDAYHTYLPIERFPIVVLYIEGDPYLTDVNVHPAKHQIRLSKEAELLKLIEETIRETIRNIIRVPQMEKKEKIVKPATEQLNIWKPAPKIDVEKMNAIVEKLYDVQTIQENNLEQIVEPKPISMVREENWQPTSQIEAETIDEVTIAVQSEILEEMPTKEPFPELEVVGQIHGTYIVAQMEDGFYLIDQHAAQERIKYEFFREKVGQVNPHERQALLLPLTFHYAADEALILRELRHELEAVGVFLEEFGQSSFVVREHPSWFPQGEEQEIIEDLIEQVLTTKKADIKKLREAAAIMMSCKKSIKANHYLTKEQMETLLRDLRNADNPFTCPHGRPVLIHFTSYEVEKMFKRVM
ncbi:MULTISPECIES: DNA mismatch repair endonuclease MutL [Lysinibacillus]|uniref:DNA mismatch repair endonuclease MutL n=1 Tax=Lysinibacillus TaxID=400634 RepID=UPI0021A7B133|nr:DNA mismatch repair endonuclease MutL [Lysinibacillus capsici]MCT1540868.1 DNA mismatch repair endonuclease MutL [Lysinibacillus capsici]MCT1572062.1 DNA mismatch repair endonuclease MutL [Lysinibacillus capsici]MCT1649227.1 DNA mismatch repair endonuclease MutL [Lysinibacillus capsici]MCT1727706.1 DNA mismatch repair endonuclease MutL [Lysinibacillus capsici]MCT1785222.1 DNA mismatch repair endonuclease MutL [Lysinibacillus capsici]